MTEVELMEYIEHMDAVLRNPWEPRANRTVCYMDPDVSTERDAELATIELRRRHPEIPGLSAQRVHWSRATPSETAVARFR